MVARRCLVRAALPREIPGAGSDDGAAQPYRRAGEKQRPHAHAGKPRRQKRPTSPDRPPLLAITGAVNDIAGTSKPSIILRACRWRRRHWKAVIGRRDHSSRVARHHFVLCWPEFIARARVLSRPAATPAVGRLCANRRKRCLYRATRDFFFRSELARRSRIRRALPACDRRAQYATERAHGVCVGTSRRERWCARPISERLCVDW